MRITAKDSVCLIVDYQEKILPAIANRERLIENSVKLLQGLRILGIPMVMLAAPATPSCYIMAKSMKNDDVLTASIIVVTTLLAAFTLTGWIFILRTMGYI